MCKVMNLVSHTMHRVRVYGPEKPHTSCHASGDKFLSEILLPHLLILTLVGWDRPILVLARKKNQNEGLSRIK